MATAPPERRHRDEETNSPVGSNKKQKLHRHDSSGLKDVDSEAVGATELASAFALASLASLSPQQSRNDPDPESRDAENGNDYIPISPETRSPVRRNRRVTFSTDTKAPKSDVARSVSFSPRTTKLQASRMPPGFAHPSFSSRAQNMTPPFWMMHQQMPISVSAFRMPVVSMNPQGGKWICDFCNSASFDTFQEACVHEETCHMKCAMASPHASPPHNMWNRTQAPPPSFSPHQDFNRHQIQSSKCYVDPIASSSRKWFQGSTSLAIPDSDKEWLSNVNCFIRTSCVEAFSATDDDVSKNSKRGRISVHQVGIRCCFCRNRPREEKEVAAVSYPASISGIYESVKRWQRVHLDICQDIPSEVKTTIDQFGNANAWIPTTRQYWVDSARALGMVDTHEGIRFSLDPRMIPFNSSSELKMSVTPAKPEVEDAGEVRERRQTGNGISEGENIVFSEDMALVPPYVYFLMKQVEGTHFTEADRFVARSKGPVGYPGFQCRHCHGHAGLGKYFPVSSKSLSTNSTSQNIHSHMLKCRKVNQYVKEQLLVLKEEKSKSPRLEPGWRRIFFEKIWERLHGS